MDGRSGEYVKEDKTEPVLTPGAMSRPVDTYDAPGLTAKRGSRRFHVMVKPTGAACNLACSCCFYLGKASRSGTPAPRRMSDEVLTEFIRQHIGSETGDRAFSRQGGEPGLNYLCRGFKQFFAYALPQVDRIVKHLRGRNNMEVRQS